MEDGVDAVVTDDLHDGLGVGDIKLAPRSAMNNGIVIRWPDV